MGHAEHASPQCVLPANFCSAWELGLWECMYVPTSIWRVLAGVDRTPGLLNQNDEKPKLDAVCPEVCNCTFFFCCTRYSSAARRTAKGEELRRPVSCLLQSPTRVSNGMNKCKFLLWQPLPALQALGWEPPFPSSSWECWGQESSWQVTWHDLGLVPVPIDRWWWLQTPETSKRAGWWPKRDSCKKSCW